MSSLRRRLFALALCVSAAPASAAPACAAPAPARLVERVMPVRVPLMARVSAARSTLVPVHGQFGVRAVSPTPIRALPLLAPPAPMSVLPAFLPRLGLATLLAPLSVDDCAAPRSTVLMAALPTTPFTAMTCKREPSMGDGQDRPTSLVPGHNKNALYGRAYSPSGGDGP